MASSFLLLSFLAASAVGSASTGAPDCTFASSYPRQYVVEVLPAGSPSIVVDGKLDEAAWTEVPFTQAFVDISTSTVPHLLTQAKLRYNATHLFVGARLQEPHVSVCALSAVHFRRRVRQ